MEQKRTLWIVAAAGVFLLVVVGAALILYSPSLHRSQVQQAGFDPSTGWVTTNITSDSESAFGIKSAENVSAQQPVFTSNEDKFVENSIATTAAGTNPFERDSRNEISQIHADNLTVISENAAIYTNHANEVSETATIDLNALKSSNITAQNKYTENLMAVNQPPAPPAPEFKKVETKHDEPLYPVREEPKYVEKTEAPVKAVAKAEPSKPAAVKAPAKTVSAKPAAKPAPKATPKPAVQKVPDSFWVQAAAYTSKKNADEARSVLEANKMPTEVFTADSNGKTYYRVRVGPYLTKNEAEYWQSKISKIEKFADTKSVIINSSAKSN